MTAAFENVLSAQEIISQGLAWGDMNDKQREAIIRYYRDLHYSWRDIASLVGKRRQNHSTILQWWQVKVLKKEKKPNGKTIAEDRLQQRLEQLEQELVQLKENGTPAGTIYAAAPSAPPTIPHGSIMVPPPPPPPPVGVTGSSSLTLPRTSGGQIDWCRLTRADLDAIPPEVIEAFSPAEKKELFRHMAMSPAEREAYLQEQARLAAEKEQEKEAGLALASDMCDNMLFQQLQAKANAHTTTSQGRVGNWTATYEYQDMRICLGCQKLFQVEGKKKASASCPSCGTDDPEKVVEWSPSLDPEYA